MKLNDYPWLASPYQHLTTPILQNRAHHALLISYIQGSGEDELIKMLANRLLCQTPNQTEPCLQCHSCKLFLADNHPDYSVITNDQGKQSIGVDKIRTMASNVYEKPQQGGNKVIWIKNAALMTDAAANALLKTLEEPPGNTYFILSDDHNSKFLPTIYSRCFAYFLTVPALEQSIEWLKQKHQQYSDNELAAALLLSENAPLAATAILEPEKWQQRKNFCEKLLNILPQNDYWSMAKIIDYEQFIERINWFCTLLSDALKAKQKAGRFIVNRDQVPLVRLLANNDSEKITQLYDLWLKTREQLLTITGINKELMAYNLFAQSELIKWA